MTGKAFWIPPVPGRGLLGGLVVVEAGDQTSATNGSGGIAVDWRWGVDTNGDPYFETAGSVTDGEEAVLAVDADTGTYYLVETTI